MLAMTYLNQPYVSHIIKLYYKFQSIKGYASGTFLEVRKLLDITCPMLEAEVDYDAISLKEYL